MDFNYHYYIAMYLIFLPFNNLVLHPTYQHLGGYQILGMYLPSEKEEKRTAPRFSDDLRAFLFIKTILNSDESSMTMAD
jgi:hypothetical protein